MIPDRFQVIEGWPEQLRRIERWHRRLRALLQEQNGALDEEGFDFVYAFFQSSHHLRDWLLNSGAATRNQLDQLRDSTPALQLCEDICNNSKHYKRNGSVRVSHTLGFQREYAPLNGEYGERWSIVWESPDTGFERRDLIQLVDECTVAWSTFCGPAPPGPRPGRRWPAIELRAESSADHSAQSAPAS